MPGPSTRPQTRHPRSRARIQCSLLTPWQLHRQRTTPRSPRRLAIPKQQTMPPAPATSTMRALSRTSTRPTSAPPSRRDSTEACCSR
ncbi:uncharacterized protein BDZ83DRAFT_601988 [Colletotrichum acutatum]|uniref:Uncharacterized protein n=1 Tax=Glomerella acutata TaxID=27357 RepID=A0AAD8XMN9_GLOAC|nr:uncharacterized protein BDZ83DRAFT_601988 [Colletotrichum acutatum]KAK1730228.1 hypothetical protein BDZ83DRAFT_601988 [Colletotrichum acutatum]